MLYLYTGGLIVSLLCGWVILWKVPVLSYESDEVQKLKTVTIIIPARNEEKNLPNLLASIQKQSLQPFEIIVVDDQSDDQTVSISRSYGAKVLQIQPDEKDWIGKSAACFTGAEAAQGEWLFFLDADSYFADENSLLGILQLFEKEETGLLSIQPHHEVRAFYEHLSVVFNLLVLAGMNQFSVFGKRLQPGGAFGPSLVTARKTYFQLGGHKRVKDSIMENIEFGKKYLENNLPVNLYGGKNTLHFRMYPDGLGDLIEGWGKSFASGSAATHPMILVGTSLWIGGAFLSILVIGFSFLKGDIPLIVLAGLGYVTYYFQFLKMARAAGNFKEIILLFYPFLFVSFILIFTWSAIRTFLFRTVSWKGRKMKV